MPPQKSGGGSPFDTVKTLTGLTGETVLQNPTPDTAPAQGSGTAPAATGAKLVYQVCTAIFDNKDNQAQELTVQITDGTTTARVYKASTAADTVTKVFDQDDCIYLFAGDTLQAEVDTSPNTEPVFKVFLEAITVRSSNTRQ